LRADRRGDEESGEGRPETLERPSEQTALEALRKVGGDERHDEDCDRRLELQGEGEQRHADDRQAEPDETFDGAAGKQGKKASKDDAGRVHNPI